MTIYTLFCFILPFSIAMILTRTEIHLRWCWRCHFEYTLIFDSFFLEVKRKCFLKNFRTWSIEDFHFRLIVFSLSIQLTYTIQVATFDNHQMSNVNVLKKYLSCIFKVNNWQCLILINWESCILLKSIVWRRE